MTLSTTLRLDDGDFSPQELADTLAKLPRILKAELEQAAADIGARMAGAAAEGAPVDTGRLRADLTEPLVESVGETLIRIRIGSNTPQAGPMEEGTDPGHFPPPHELHGWVRRVLGADDVESTAFLVARSISESGLDGHHMIRDAIGENIEWALSRINTAITNAFENAGLA